MCPNLHKPKRRKIGDMNKQFGLGLPAAIFVIVVLSLIVLALANMEERSAESLGQDVQSIRAFLAAESGAQAGLSALFPPGGTGIPACSLCTSALPHTALKAIDFNSLTGGAPAGLVGCSFSVSCCMQTDSATPANRYFRLQSRGVCGSGVDRAERGVEVGARDITP